MSLLDYWDTLRPSVKRRKTTADDTDDTTSLSDAVTGREDGLELPEASAVNPDVSDPVCTPCLGQEPEGDDLPFPASQTELESSLPAIETDSHAIEEYEASHSILDHEEEPGLRERLRDGKWRKGKSSIYVDAFNLALETVLDEEAHLFDEAEMEVFKQWKELPYESQYLYVRLFLRKTSAWHRINRLGYYSDISDLTSVVNDLQRTRTLPPSPTETPIDMEHPETPKLATQFHFADKTDQITTLEEASALLLLDELKTLAKDAKVQGKSKKDLLTALHRASQQQTGLDWTNSKATANRASHFIHKILDYTGECIRLATAPRALFERVHLVFYRSTEWTEKSLTTIILAKISRRNFPDYVVCRSSSIFPSRAFLLEFESALRTQFNIDKILEFSGTPTVQSLTQVRDYACTVYPRWKTLCEQEQQKEDSVYECGEGAYLRRFSPAWVYTRIIHKGLYPLGRFKEYKEEHRLLSELLGQRLFHAARRGSWYQRKALLEEHYLWNLVSWDGRSEDAQRKHWRRIALQTCEEGLQDPDCHLIYHYDLQKRIMKLERALKVVKREQHDFSHVMLAKPAERTVEGIRIEREDSPAQDDSTRRGRPTVWVDERDGGECRVESMCLSWYRDLGWKGYHSEGGIVRTLFGYLFYDILFTYVPNVFQTAFQTCPLDLHTDAFYATRASEINHRLVEITNGESERILRAVHAREAPRQPCAIGIDWTFELDDLVDIVRCFRGEALAAICKVLAQEYQQRGGGIPDLFLWRVKSREVMFVEVKSENDRLSDTQRLWIHVLGGAGVRVELCNAVAREVRYL
ncbi:coiled-coil domain-containing protein MTMR15 [Aspergillus bombycis]|uniref:Fanconi-associated nuclease n=1 Tax=Aspergillus bombycis TaxID=109264 RepID=A0A1F8AHL4_9EURO|nr:coiled-coil domain-containing protein MTMR15 [Aspergillus bombycis]OGM50788.1 coiled-coil domain-containing protein MTMR15 [Aspergillus bombycis]